MISTFEMELNNIVYKAVKRTEYPSSPIPISDAELRTELKNLKSGIIPRPKTKEEYVALLASLETQISDIKAQNEKAQVEYQTVKKTIDETFDAAIQAAKLDETNRWAAIRAYRNYLLKECDWTQLPDNSLSEESLIAWKTYRKLLRDLPQTFIKSNDVVFPVKP